MVKASPAPRRYDSPLRAEQAQATRERILAALTRVLARGVADLSVPAVAREAGVSVPTVYRHFGSKRELIHTLAAHLTERQGFTDHEWPHSPEELAANLRRWYARVDAREAEIGAALSSEAGREARRVTLEQRARLVHSTLHALARQLPADDYARLHRTVLLFTTSEAIGFFREYLDLSIEEAADTAGWAIRALAHAAKTMEEEADG